jgi:hypothetical protein
MVAITVRTLQELPAGAILWDDRVPGFGVRRQTRDPYYVLKYRHFGRQRWVTIGRHGAPWTPDTARREAQKLLGLVASGKDPADAKALAWDEASETVGKVAERYLGYAQREQRPRTLVETKRHLLVDWKPLPAVSVYHLKRRQVAERLREIEIRKSTHGTSSSGGAVRDVQLGHPRGV